MVAVHWLKWPPCPYIVKKKPSNIFFSRTKGALGLNLCTNHRGWEVYSKWWSYFDVWMFLQQGQICFPVHLYGPGTFVWKKCRAFQTTSSVKKVREKFRECHNHKPKPFPDTKRKRKQTKPNKRNFEQTYEKALGFSCFLPKRGNHKAKRTEKHKNKLTQGKT